MKKKSIYFFVGTTAELIKLAPIIYELKNRKIDFKFITSGQTSIQFEDLRDYVGDINVYKAFKEKSGRSSIPLFGIWALRSFLTGVFSLKLEFKGLNKNNSYFIIHGDTVSSLIGAFIAKIYGLKLVHIESGLRSFDFLEPFPEEICRYIIIHLADILFAPNKWALDNLKGLSGEKINTFQNTLIEPCKWALNSKNIASSTKYSHGYYILTMHRQEHILFRKEWTRAIIKFVIKNTDKNLHCIIIAHHLTTEFIQNLKFSPLIRKKLTILSRLPYAEFMKLMNGSKFIATDGCTNQEEAYYMGKPLLALRNRTERVEGLNKNTILAKGKKKIIQKFLNNYKNYETRPVYSKMKPSKIVVDYLVKH